jgi:hypothetical protein
MNVTTKKKRNKEREKATYDPLALRSVQVAEVAVNVTTVRAPAAVVRKGCLRFCFSMGFEYLGLFTGQ